MRLAVLVLWVALLSSTVAASPGGDSFLDVRVANDGESPVSVTLQIVEAASGDEVHRETIDVEPGDVTTVQVQVPPAVYHVRVAGAERPVETGPRLSEVAVTAQADLRGCPGPYQVGFRVARNAPATPAFGWGMVATDVGACLVRPTAMDDLLDEASAAMAGPTEGQPVAVPLPRDGDRGERLSWDGLLAPVWTEASPRRFEWGGPASLVDRWGRDVNGVVLSEWVPVDGRSFAEGPLGTSAEIPAHFRQDVRLYGAGEVRPFASSAGFGHGVAAALASSEVAYETHVRYEALPRWVECLYRTPLQGTTVAPGDAFDAHGVCAAAPDGASWWAGAARTVDGLAALPLYLVDERGGTTTVARVTLADGLAYPLELDVWREAYGGARHEAYRLHALDTQGEPMPIAPAEEAPPTLVLAPLDPTRGPALQTARERFPFPLDEAVDAALADPRIAGPTALVTRPDTVLVAAMLGTSRESAHPPVDRHVWSMRLTINGQDVYAQCARASSTNGAAPVTICEPMGEDAWQRDVLAGLPTVDGSSLPAQAASWDLAVERWDRLAGGDAGRQVARAFYAAAGTSTPAHLDLGGDRTGSELPLAPSDESASTGVSLALADGSTVSETRVLFARSGLDQIPASLTTGGGASVGPGPTDGPLSAPVVGRAIAAGGLVALLLYLLGPGKAIVGALFTRLTRPKLLQHPIRRALYDSVRGDPGLTAPEAARAIDENPRTVEYHLEVLVREGLFVQVESGGYRRHFVKGSMTREQMQAACALRVGAADKVFAIIDATPGVSLKDVVAKAGISKPYASTTVSQLVDAGLVDKVRQGRKVALYPASRAGRPQRNA